MSRRRKPKVAADAAALVFSALGDPTRLQLLGRLSEGEAVSISGLSAGAAHSRQAVTKHLRVLELAGLVKSTRSGRETRFVFSPGPILTVQEYLASVSAQWDAALSRLKAFVESKD